MKGGIVFSFQPDQILAVRTADREQFLLKRWQYELLTRLDGKKTFEEASREVYRMNSGGFSAVGLLNFYNWLYNEDIVICECASVFELVTEEFDVEEITAARPAKTSNGPSEFEMLDDERDEPQSLVSRLWGNQNARRVLTASAAVAFSLAVLRIGYVASPIVFSPAKKVIAQLNDARVAGPETKATSETVIPDSTRSELQLSGRALEETEAPVIEPTTVSKSELQEIPDIPEVPEVSKKVKTAEQVPAKPATAAQLEVEMEELRRELAGCRVRRDEFYIQNDEAGYRREVKRMIELAKTIGEIEAKL